MTRGIVPALAFSLLSIALTACSSNLSRFDVINTQPQTSTQITRAEIADQGSGSVASVVGPGGHTMTRTTVGGHYLRRNDVRAPARTQLSAGLYGNPRASN